MGQFKQLARHVILVIEDEPPLRMTAVDMVHEAGFDAIEARDSDEAIAILERRTDVRVVVVDADMPGAMAGMKLAAVIRDRWPPIEMIITSANAFLDDSVIPAHTVFFPKPYAQGEVIATLRRLVGA